MTQSYLRTLHLTFLIVFTLSTSNLFAAPEELPITLPTGTYTFQGNLFKKFLKRSKVFDHNDPAEAQTIKNLKKSGYVCIRRSMTATLCQQKSTDFDLPPNTPSMVESKLRSFPIQFPVNPLVELTHNGSTTKEWMVRGPFTIGDKTFQVYRLSRTYEGEIFLAFPVDDENPISFLTYRESKGLGYTMVLQGTDTEGWKLAYYFEALYQPTSNGN